ncbi:MCE family protein, partial [Helicobacter pylori]
MERHVNYTLIGGLFFLCLVCMVGFILWLGHLGLDDGKYYEYVVYTDKDLGGIATNSPINYKGIQVGNVIKVGFAKDKVGVVRLDLMIKSSVKIRKDSKVAVSSRGFMGLKFLALEQSHNEEFYGSGDKGERILIFKEGLMDRLSGDANQVVQEVMKAIRNVNRIL